MSSNRQELARAADDIMLDVEVIENFARNCAEVFDVLANADESDFADIREWIEKMSRDRDTRSLDDRPPTPGELRAIIRRVTDKHTD